MNAALGNSSNCNEPPPSLQTQGGVRCGDRTTEDNMGLSHPKGSGLQGFTDLTLAFSAQARDPWAGSPAWQRRWSDEVTSPGMPPCTRPTCSCSRRLSWGVCALGSRTACSREGGLGTGDT